MGNKTYHKVKGTYQYHTSYDLCVAIACERHFFPFPLELIKLQRKLQGFERGDPITFEVPEWYLKIVGLKRTKP